MAPIKKTEGTKILWFEVLKICLVRCGIANPIKAMGPAKAVTAPAIRLVDIIIINRLRLTFRPRLWA
jgi:hypothetical protein